MNNKECQEFIENYIKENYHLLQGKVDPCWDTKSFEEVEMDEMVAWLCTEGISDEVDDFELIESEGGGEGGSENCHSVFSLGGKTFMAQYYYYSHYGWEMDGVLNTLKEVTPVVKKVVVYE